MARIATVHRVPMRHPGDVSGVAALLDAGALDPADIVAILGKTEGNGCVNDFTRAYAVQALSVMLAGRLALTPEAVAARIAMVMSGGTEGGLSPHFLVFSVRTTDAAATGALAMGTAFTRDFAPEEIGRMPQLEATAAAVRAAMADAALTSPADVHYVQIKCPLLTSERIAAAEARGATVATHDTYASMGLSRGASALVVALALGEVPAGALSDAVIGQDTTLFSHRASASAGVELTRNEIVVLGNSASWAGDLTIAHAVMQDGIDLPAIHAALRGAGLDPGAGQLAPDHCARLVALLAKAEPSSSGRIRGNRHIMNDDSDINATRHARALVCGVAAAAVGRTDLFISGGAEHQGPDGGGPVAAIARKEA
ncbi:ring-opening amidohydrolase [Roseomonas eburnea]|uniref:Cyanuric acid amidohydrolase n=1 Tax=Neoroseomonas eburnea TaxID=1346889 RepID=A0A9X9X868_9PROT|nr:ring-opening amidohydrolase [Neoroseomonas eburnea]MBR0679904.1 ring-opening amidohydrolase [Neoroseomonas eburnea]